MTYAAPLAERLRALRRRDRRGTAPLWIEGLPAEEALDELRHREGILFRLQECQKLLEFGRGAEACERLRRLDAPPGLETVRVALLARAEGMNVPARFDDPLEPEALGGTLPSAEAALVEWLGRVRGWRRNLHV